MRIKRTIYAKAEGHCCKDDKVVKNFPHLLSISATENSKDFPGLLKISMEDWKNESYSTLYMQAEAIFDGDCPGGSTYGCNISLHNVHVNEETFITSFEEFEEMIYDAYLKKYHIRLIPTNVTNATAYMKEYGMSRSEKIPAHGIDIERYCIGDWCFDTIAHTNTFIRRYSKVTSILENLKI